jgi:H+/Cl- antiporter ClcA
VGATAGSVFWGLIGLDRPTFSAIGLVALLAETANTPIAASILAVDLFGLNIASYAALASVISFLMTGHRSVYPSQMLDMMKSPHPRSRAREGDRRSETKVQAEKKRSFRTCKFGMEANLEETEGMRPAERT